MRKYTFVFVVSESAKCFNVLLLHLAKQQAKKLTCYIFYVDLRFLFWVNHIFSISQAECKTRKLVNISPLGTAIPKALN